MVTKLAFLLVSIFVITGCTSKTPPTTTTIQLGNESFTLDLATDVRSRTRGLMYETSIPINGGLLFVFPDRQERSFWMKNCVIDIDIAFLDSRGIVTAIHTMVVEPPQRKDEHPIAYDERLRSYRSFGPAQFAIELRAGTFSRLHIRVNDRIPLELPMLKGLAR